MIAVVGELPRPRWLRQFRAWLFGYYWLPCPICGQRYAAFEAGEVTLDIPGTSKFLMTCKRHAEHEGPIQVRVWPDTQQVER